MEGKDMEGKDMEGKDMEGKDVEVRDVEGVSGKQKVINYTYLERTKFSLEGLMEKKKSKRKRRLINGNKTSLFRSPGSFPVK